MDLKQQFDILGVLARKEIKTRYKNSVFGYFWSLGNPIAFTLIFYFAFEVVFKAGVPKFVLFLMTGLFSWQWMSNFVTGSTKHFVANTSLIKKVNFPRYIIPLSVNLQDAFHFLLTIPILLVMMYFYHVPYNFNLMLGIPLIFIAQFFMLYGMGLFLASLNIFFRDIEHISIIIMNMVFYLTPVLYPIEKIPENIRWMMLMNVFAPSILAWRALFLNGELNMQFLGLSYLYAALFMLIGVYFYRKLVWKIPELL